MGGITSAQKLPAKGVYVFRLFLPDWATFEKPGRYALTIRRKLEPNPSQPRYFRTEPGVGVRFVPGGSDSGGDGGNRPPKPQPSDGREDQVSG